MKEKAETIDCQEFGEIYLELDRPGTRGAELNEQALAHAETCSACGSLLIEAESLGFSLRKVADVDSDLQAPPRVEAELLEEFRRVRPTAASSRTMRWEFVVMAVAAMVLLALGVEIYRHQLKTSGGTNQPSLNASGNSSGPSGPTQSKPNDAATVPSVAASSSSNANTDEPLSASATNSADSSDEEYATAFVPLPYADGLTEADGGTVVRVDLPRSSLASMGIPVSGLGFSERVVADLVVSEDGTPQAIRLVSPSTAANANAAAF